eukprot:262686-Chlamydomonas_euryale.AAC.4
MKEAAWICSTSVPHQLTQPVASRCLPPHPQLPLACQVPHSTSHASTVHIHTRPPPHAMQPHTVCPAPCNWQPAAEVSGEATANGTQTVGMPQQRECKA